MIFELVLGIATMTSACGVSATIPVVNIEITGQGGWGSGGIGAGSITKGTVSAHYQAVTCGQYPEWRYVRLAEYPDYMSCMQKVAAIGAGDNVNAICREKK